MPSMTAGMYSFGIAPPTILFYNFDALALFIRLDLGPGPWPVLAAAAGLADETCLRLSAGLVIVSPIRNLRARRCSHQL